MSRGLPCACLAKLRIHWLRLLRLEVMRRTGKAKSNVETRKKSRVKAKPTAQPHPISLKGWQDIAGFLGQPISVAQRWAQTGMPVTREGRFVTASPEALNAWLGRESGTGPIHVATPQTDLSAELKRGPCVGSTRRVENSREGDGRIWYLTRQELAELLPHKLQAFLDHVRHRAFWPYASPWEESECEQKQNAP